MAELGFFLGRYGHGLHCFQYFMSRSAQDAIKTLFLCEFLVVFSLVLVGFYTYHFCVALHLYLT